MRCALPLLITALALAVPVLAKGVYVVVARVCACFQHVVESESQDFLNTTTSHPQLDNIESASTPTSLTRLQASCRQWPA